MINANNSSGDFYFGHFVEAEDVPQLHAKLFFTNLNNGLCEVVLNFIYYSFVPNCKAGGRGG